MHAGAGYFYERRFAQIYEGNSPSRNNQRKFAFTNEAGLIVVTGIEFQNHSGLDAVKNIMCGGMLAQRGLLYIFIRLQLHPRFL